MFTFDITKYENNGKSGHLKSKEATKKYQNPLHKKTCVEDSFKIVAICRKPGRYPGRIIRILQQVATLLTKNASIGSYAC